MAEWKYVDSSNFKRTAPLYKCRFHMGNVPAGTPKYESTEGCFVELPNINMDLKSPSEYNTAEYGWPRHHKFNMVYSGGRYTNGSTSEVAIILLPSVGPDVYELEFPQTLYWGGVSDRNDPGTTPIYVNGDLIEVYGDFHTFTSDKSTIKFEQTGGTDTVTISAESDWTATTTDDWYTMDITSGVSGDTVITISTNSAAEVKRGGSIHFEDGDGYTFDITVKQKGIQLGQPLHLGNLEVPTLFLGGESVVMAYLGEEQVYSSGPFVGLKIPKTKTFKRDGETQNFTVKSSEDWTLTIDPNCDWLTASQTTGTTGKTVIELTADENTGTTELTTVITATTENFSATCEVTLVYLVMPTNEVWYKTSDGNQCSRRGDSYFTDINNNRINPIEEVKEGDYWKMKFAVDVYGSYGSLYYQYPYTLTEIWFPYYYTNASLESGSIALYNHANLEYIYGDSPMIVSNNKLLLSKYGSNQIEAYQAAKVNGGDIVIPEGVDKIHYYCFQKTHCDSITFPSTLTTIQSYALEDSVFTDLYCYALTPPTVESDWRNWGPENVTVHLKQGATGYESVFGGKGWTFQYDLD